MDRMERLRIHIVGSIGVMSGAVFLGIATWVSLLLASSPGGHPLDSTAYITLGMFWIAGFGCVFSSIYLWLTAYRR